MIRTVSRYFAYGGGAILLVCAILVSLDVVFRKLFNVIPFYSFELTEYGFAMAIAFGYGYGLLDKAHIRVDPLYNKFRLPVRTVLDLIALVALTGCVLGLAYYAGIVAQRSFKLGAVSNTTLAMPLAIPQTIWALGLSWFALVCVVVLLKCLKLWFQRRNTEIEKLVGSSHEV